MHDTHTPVREYLSVGDIELEVIRHGAGRPVVLLHGMHNVDPRAPFLDLLGSRAEVIAPSHPGFGHSSCPANFDTVYDLVHLYLAVLDSLPYERVTLIGLSFGGWLAAEIAVACQHRIDRLILVDAVGIKISDRETPDILDVFNTAPEVVRRHSWHNPAKSAPDFDTMSDDEIVLYAKTGTRCACTAGIPICTTRSSNVGWAGSAGRPSCCGGRVTELSHRPTVEPTAA